MPKIVFLTQMKLELKNQHYQGSSNRTSLYDVSIPENYNGNFIIFCHGYMGFKDWGCWNLVADFFTKVGYGFCKYNVSHNGGTIHQAIDFPDLEAFAANSYSKELYDSEAIIGKIQANYKPNKIFLIGHSRGGGIMLLHCKNQSISGIISWAGISSIASRFPIGEELETWKKDGVRFGVNMRTKQKMPHNYSQYLDFLEYQDKLSIETIVKNRTLPVLIIHGEEDTAVSIQEGMLLAAWSKTTLVTIPQTNHTFDAAHPWDSATLPDALQRVCKETLTFIQHHEQ